MLKIPFHSTPSRPSELHLHSPHKTKNWTSRFYAIFERCLWSVNCVMLNLSVFRVRAFAAVLFGQSTLLTRNAFIRCFTVYREKERKKNTGCCSNFYSRCRNTKKMNVDLDVPSVPVRSTYISKKFKESTQELVREIKTHPNEGKKRKKQTNTHTQSASQDLIQMNIREKRMKKVQWQ